MKLDQIQIREVEGKDSTFPYNSGHEQDPRSQTMQAAGDPDHTGTW